KMEGILIITADHGNADEMYHHDKAGKVVRDAVSGVPQAKTSHTINPVPFMVYDPNRNDRYFVEEERNNAGIASVTATCLELLGFVPPDDLEPSLLRFK